MYTVHEETYYKYPIEELSEVDKSHLLFVKLFLKDPLQLSKLLPNVLRKDSFEHLEAPSVPAYHENDQCDNLFHQYTNFELPACFAGQEKLVQAIRRVYIQIMDELKMLDSNDERDMDEIRCEAIVKTIDCLRTAQHLQPLLRKVNVNPYDLTIDSFLPVTRKNSSYTNLDFIEEEIDSLYRDFKTDVKQTVINKKIKQPHKIQMQAKSVFKRNGYDKLFVNLLVEFIIQELNPKLKFEKEVLKNLGFKPCSKCTKSDLDEPDNSPIANDPVASFRNRMHAFYNVIGNFGKVSFINAPENPLKSKEDLHAAGEGLYFCLHTFTRKIQAAYKRPDGGWHYFEVPKDEAGRVIITKEYELWHVKTKDLTESISGKGQEILIVPVNDDKEVKP